MSIFDDVADTAKPKPKGTQPPSAQGELPYNDPRNPSQPKTSPPLGGDPRNPDPYQAPVAPPYDGGNSRAGQNALVNPTQQEWADAYPPPGSGDVTAMPIEQPPPFGPSAIAPGPDVNGATTTGLEPGTSFMQGVDMTVPGAAEKFFAEHGTAFTQPGFSQTHAADVQNRYGGGNTPGVSNTSQGVLAQAQGAPPPQNVQNTFEDTRAHVPADQGMQALTRIMQGLPSKISLGANAGALTHFGQNVPGAVDPNAGAGAYGDFKGNTPANVSLDEAKNTLSTFRGDVPLSQDAYYDNASRKANERLRTAMAARGTYGSSATDDQMREMEMELAADQARTDADYRLKRANTESSLANSADAAKLSGAGYGLNRAQLGGSLASLVDAMTMEKGKYGLSRAGLEGTLSNAADQSMATAGDYGLKKAGIEGTQATNADQTALARAKLLGDQGAKADDQQLQRLGLLGTLAQGADSSSAAGATNELNWAKGLSGIASTADQDRLSGLVAGMGAAGSAQGAQRTRGQDAFGNEITMGNALSGAIGDSFKDMSDRDIQLLMEQLGMFTGTGAEGYAQATRGQAQTRADATAATDRDAATNKVLLGLVDAFKKSQNPAGSSATP